MGGQGERQREANAGAGRRSTRFFPSLPEDEPHVIRLRGPWQYQALARTRRLADGSSQAVEGPLPPPGTTDLPADWSETLGADFRGRVAYTRRFGCPTGLAPGDVVQLVIERVDAFATCWLNDQLLGQIGPEDQPFRADVTDRLKPRNLLRVEVELPEMTTDSAALPRPRRPGLPSGLMGEVRLEIFPNALRSP